MAEWSPKIRRVSGDDDRKSLASVSALLSEGRFKDAEYALAPILDTESRSFGANIGMGRALQGQGRFEEAQHYLSRAVEIDPMEASAHLLSGLSAYMVGDYLLAAKRFKTSIDINPKSTMAHLGLARVLYHEGDSHGAVLHIEEALRLDPQSAAARLLRARIFSRGGDVEGALCELKSLLDHDPNNQLALVSIALIEFKRGNDREAAAVLTHALKFRDETGLIWGLLGYIKLKAKAFPEAEDAIRKSMHARKRGSGPGKALQLIETLVPQGKLDEAKSVLNRLPRFGALAIAVQKAYGDIYYAEGQYELAASAYRAAFTQTEDGEEELAKLEALLVAENPDAIPKRAAEIIGRGLSERLAVRRQHFLDQEWHALLDKYEPMMGHLAEMPNARPQSANSRVPSIV